MIYVGKWGIEFFGDLFCFIWFVSTLIDMVVIGVAF